MKSCLLFSLLVSVVIVFYLWVYTDGFNGGGCNSNGKRNTAQRISQISTLDNANLLNEVSRNMQIEKFTNNTSWSPVELARLHRTITNDDPLHHYLDGIQLYSKIVKDKIVIKLESPFDFRNVISLVMDFAKAHLVKSISFSLDINDGKTTRVIPSIDHNCTAEELVVKNGQLLYIILPVPTNLKQGYKLNWSIVLNGTPFELMMRNVFIVGGV